VFRDMAFFALHASMLPFEGIARLLMIEGLGIPLDERKVEAVVIGVALRAFLAGACPDAKREVQAFVSRKAGGNFGVAIEALENRLAAQLVAGRTASSAFKVLVSASKGSRRNLGANGSRQKSQEREDMEEFTQGHRRYVAST